MMEGKIKIETILNWKSETKPFHFFLIIESKKTPRSESENLSKRFLCFFRYGPEVFPEHFVVSNCLLVYFLNAPTNQVFFPHWRKITSKSPRKNVFPFVQKRIYGFIKNITEFLAYSRSNIHFPIKEFILTNE